MTNPFTDYAFATADAGTVDRTLPDRLTDIHNVRDYGAVGDGVTDDWAAIGACYNANTYFITASASNLVASFTGVVTSATFTGTISGFNLTTSGVTGTIAIGQTIRVGATPCIITSGSGSSWVVDVSQTVGPVAMETNNILVASGGSSASIAVNDWLINNGGTDASPSTIYPTYITSIQGGGVYVLRQYTTADADRFETLLQNFTSQAMMTVSSTVSLSTPVANTGGQDAYDADNATVFGDGFANGGQLNFVISSSTITVNSDVSGLVHIGDRIGFQYRSKGIMYFPPGDYYVSEPIVFTTGNPGVIWRGEFGATTLSGNFNDFVLKQSNSSSELTLIEKLNIVNTHATGGGIRIGGTNVGVVRDCTVTANQGISDYDGRTHVSGYFGAFELTIENCHVNAGANYSGSIGIAKQSDGPVTNCSCIGYERGFITAGGEGAQVLLGCYFEQCGRAIVLNRGPDGGNYVSTNAVIAGCWLKNNSIGIELFGSTAAATIIGIRIEGANGQAPGGANSQYGFVTGDTGGSQGNMASSMLAGITVVGEFDVSGILIAGKTAFVYGPNLLGVADSSTCAHPFDLDTFNGNVYIATQIACSARHIYTVATIPTSGNNAGEQINVSDGTNTLSWGDPLTGTGTHTTHHLAQWNGSNWTAAGK